MSIHPAMKPVRRMVQCEGIVSLAMPIPAKFHDLSVMLTNLKDSHDLTIVFWKIPITHELVE